MKRYLALGAILLGLGACSDDGGTPQLDQGVLPDSLAQDHGPGREAGADGQLVDAAPDGPKAPARWEALPGVAPSAVRFTATLLNDGRVLIVGGYRKDPVERYLDETYLYVPTKRTFVSAGKLKAARAFHTATLMTDGRVLVVGGESDSSTQMASSEIFDPTKPAASAWSSGPSLATPRCCHDAVLLKSGEVLLAGGYDYNTGILDSIAIYMPSTNGWKLPAAKMSTIRLDPTLIRLTSGKVLIVGGSKSFSTDLDTLEIYDPTSGVFALIKDKLSYAKYHPSLSLLSDGKVLIVGGVGFGTKSDEIYDPIANTVTYITHPGPPPEEHAAATLKDGTVLICGGDSTSYDTKALIYDPIGGGAWLPQPDLHLGRNRHKAVTLKDGSVLVVGGRRTNVDAYLNVAELYFP